MASLIDMDNSVFGEQTPGGGLVWEYDAKNRRELEVAIFHLRTHSGLSVTPESMPPSGIEKAVHNFRHCEQRGYRPPQVS